jgi:hypothetical protein
LFGQWHSSKFDWSIAKTPIHTEDGHFMKSGEPNVFNEIRINRFPAPRFWAVLAGIMFCSHVHAKDDPDKDEVARQDQRLKNMTRFAEQYTFFSAEDRKRQFKFHENALFRFNNPVTGSGTKDGALYMWSEHGRPQAILKFYTFNNETYAQIFLSLSERPLVAEREGNVKWNPTEPGITFRELSDAPKPADSATARLRQMKTFADHFSAAIDKFPGDAKPVELQLLSKPLFRYETSNEKDVLDGAVFSFAMGTAPQVLLLLEARPMGDSCKWYYACARLSYWPMTAKYRGKEVSVFENIEYIVDPKRTVQWLPAQRIAK